MKIIAAIFLYTFVIPIGHDAPYHVEERETIPAYSDQVDVISGSIEVSHMTLAELERIVPGIPTQVRRRERVLQVDDNSAVTVNLDVADQSSDVVADLLDDMIGIQVHLEIAFHVEQLVLDMMEQAKQMVQDYGHVEPTRTRNSLREEKIPDPTKTHEKIGEATVAPKPPTTKFYGHVGIQSIEKLTSTYWLLPITELGVLLLFCAFFLLH